MLSKWINEKLLGDKKILFFKEKFSEAKPFKNLSISKIFGEGVTEKLLLNLKKEEFFDKDSDLFHFHQTNDLAYTKNEFLKDFVDFLNSKEFSKFFEDISGIKLKAGSTDLFGSIYKKTNYLLCHDDRLENRKIAYIFYLTKDFKKGDGGEICLLESKDGRPTKVSKKYSPKWNSVVFFEVSKKSFHEVCEVLAEKERYAIGGWLH